MNDKQIIKFDMVEMEYKGGAVESDLSPVPFDGKYYGQYKNLLDDCFYEMRKELNIRPFEKHSLVLGDLNELIKQRENIFLLLDEDEIIGAFSFFGNEIGNVAVNIKYQRRGYGRRLMEFALSHMQKCGVFPIILNVNKWNKNAVALYKSLGFEVTKEVTVEGVSTRDNHGNWRFEFTATGGLNLR